MAFISHFYFGLFVLTDVYQWIRIYARCYKVDRSGDKYGNLWIIEDGAAVCICLL